jgi:hypothetical protein
VGASGKRSERSGNCLQGGDSVPGDKLTKSDIREGLPESLRPFILVESAELPLEMKPVVEAFWEATELLEGVIAWKQTINVLFGAPPFNVTVPNGVFKFTPQKDALAAYIEGMIFIDCVALMKLTRPAQVVAHLEELVHVAMRVVDEEAVKRVVTALYDGAEYKDGSYVV